MRASFLLAKPRMMQDEHQKKARRRHWFAEAILDALRGLITPRPAAPVEREWQRVTEVEAFRVWQAMKGDENPDIQIRVIRIEL
jgi:hypothetical protein